MSNEKGRCISCKYWLREFDFNSGRKTKLGRCSFLENEVRYWEMVDDVEKLVEEAKIGCQNLYTHEQFGCIHHLSIT